MFTFEIVLGLKKFVGLKVRIFGGFRWVCNSVLVDEPGGFWKGSKFDFSEFGPGFGLFLAKQVRSLGFLDGFELVRCSVLVDEPGFK